VTAHMSVSGTSVAGSESDCGWGRRMLTESSSVEAAPGAGEEEAGRWRGARGRG
jgi:hypothetical protein